MAEKVARQVEAFWYVPREDQGLPAEQQSRFKLRPLTMAERMEAFDSINVTEIRGVGATATRIIHDRQWTQARELVLEHLIDVERFPASAPEPWPGAGTREQKERYVEGMDEYLVFEIGEHLRQRSVVSAPAGNSSAPAPT